VKILVIDTYYDSFLKDIYKKENQLKKYSYKDQFDTLINYRFGTSDSYSYNLKKIGIHSDELIVNWMPLQKKWAKENNLNIIDISSKIPHKFFKLPLIKNKINSMRGIFKIALEQIRNYSPDILYCQDISFFPKEILNKIKQDNYAKLLVGQIACPLPPQSFIEPYDLIITSFPHFVDKLRNQGINSEYLKIGFDERILDCLKIKKRDIEFSFVGGISKHHSLAFKNIEYLTSKGDMEIFGYGANKLPINSFVRKNHKGIKWGLDMYKILGRSKISFNRHINTAENNANNMRLYEATGMGSLLLTDMKDNLHKIFEIDKEIVTYNSKEEALEKVKYLKNNPTKLSEIASAGQKRTLNEHTYENRMIELMEIINKYFKKI